jgi:hypothetical protein
MLEKVLQNETPPGFLDFGKWRDNPGSFAIFVIPDDPIV